MNELLEIKKQIEGATKEAATINGKIDNINSKIASRKLEIANFGESQTKALGEIREDLQADVELGNASTTQLKDLDSKIALAVADDKKCEEAAGFISGLTRKLEEAGLEAKSINTQIMSDSIKYILSEADQIGAKYVTAAHELCLLFRKLQALNSLAKGYPFSFDNASRGRLSIPAFMLESHAGLNGGPGNQALLSESFDISTDSGNKANDDIDEERGRLSAMGLIL